LFSEPLVRCATRKLTTILGGDVFAAFLLYFLVEGVQITIQTIELLKRGREISGPAT
jgi:hypothetical protein